MNEADETPRDEPCYPCEGRGVQWDDNVNRTGTSVTCWFCNGTGRKGPVIKATAEERNDG